MKEITCKKNIVYEGKILNLRCDDVILPDGKPCKREVIEHPGGAAILCVREGEILLVKQFRYAYGKELLEIPAGKLNKGEDPLSAARREFEEETGYSAERMDLLFRLFPSPGYTDEIISVFEASEICKGEQRLDEDEFLSVVSVPVDRALNMIVSGELTDAKTVAAILYYVAREYGKKNQ